MNRRFAALATALAPFLSFAGAPVQAADAPPAAEVRTVTDPASGVSETVLENGMTILVRPQPDNPVVSTMLWYAVGSRDEGVGETGLSHYLEHMLFKGTERIPVGGIDRLTQRNGGSNNAFTSFDATAYHFTFPADRWEVALEIEADRMRNSRVAPEEFGLEKEVVLDELHIGLDDPETQFWEAVETAAFPVGRYHHPVIGWAEDVESATRERMMAYYLRHYTPDRATLVVVGGVDPGLVVRRAAELFGPIPRGEAARLEQKEPPPRGETRLHLVQDTNVSRLLLSFRSLRLLDPREPLLDLAVEVLAGDKASRLHRALVEAGIATQVSAYNDSRRDDGLFSVYAQPAEGHGLLEVEARVRSVLAEFAAKGPSPEELARAKARILAAQVFQQESSMGLASRLGSHAVVGDWRRALAYPQVVEAATAEQVRDLCAGILDPAFAVIGHSVPRKGGGGGTAAPAEEDDEGEGRAPRAGARPPHRRARGDGGPPAAAPAGHDAVERALTLAPVRTVLENGLVVVVLRRAHAPLFAARLHVEDGRLGEAVPGLDEMTGALLEEGTVLRSAEQVAQAIAAVGGTLAAGPGSVYAKTLSKDASTALDLLAEVATRPAFGADAISRVKDRQLSAIAEETDTPRGLAQRMFLEEVYGASHPLGRSSKGTPESVQSITREQVVAHHARFWVPRNGSLLVVSDRDPAEVLPLVERALGGWKGGGAPKPPFPAPPAPRSAVRAAALDRAQANAFLGHLGIVRSDPDYLALEVADNVFGTGSGFTDRLSKKVRDQEGLSYSVYGTVTASAGTEPGTFTMFVGAEPANIDRAVALMRGELAAFLGDRPPTAEELEGAKAALRGAMVVACETSDGLLGVLRLCERHGLGFDYPHRYVDAVEAVAAEDVLRAARAHLHPDALVEVRVGPAGRPPAPGAPAGR